MFSKWTQLCQAVVKGHLFPEDFNLSSATPTFCQVDKSMSGLSPAFLNASLFTQRTGVDEL